MPGASHVSLTLARFEELQAPSPIDPQGQDTLFLEVGADIRASNSDWKRMEAFKFVLLGLHSSEDAARQAVESRTLIAPWFSGAMELWSGVLRPFRHFGEANFVDPQNPGPVFESVEEPPKEDSPIVILTSVGWNSFDETSMERIMRFGAGVTAVRVGMTGLPGLHSQQTFTFPGGLVHDGLTVTFWKDLKSAMGFAYGPGFHRTMVKKQREDPDGDRTSFTRCFALHHEGCWHGVDPLAAN